MCVHLATQHQMLQGIMEKHCLQEKDLAPEIQRIKMIIYPPSPEPESVVKVKSEPVVQPEAEAEDPDDPDDPAPVTSARARPSVSRVVTSARVTPSVTRVVSQGVTQAMTMQVTMIMMIMMTMMMMMMMSMTMQRPRVERIMNCFMCKEKVTTLVLKIIINLSVIFFRKAGT